MASYGVNEKYEIRALLAILHGAFGGLKYFDYNIESSKFAECKFISI